MGKIFKRLLATIMVVLMVLTSVPLSGFVGMEWLGLNLPDFSSLFSSKANAADELAATGQCGDNVYWNYDSETGEVVISGRGPMENYYDGHSPFYRESNIKLVVIESGVTTISDYAFRFCEGLQSVTIGNSVTTIGECAFGWCPSLVSVTIPDSVTTIGESAFYCCDSLQSVTIGNSVTTIGECAFGWCPSLVSVTIPNSVTTIGEDAFGDCDSLTSVTIGSGVTTIGEYAFGNCDRLTSITVDKNNQYFSNDEYGVLFNKTKTMLIQYPIANERTSYTIPDSVITIGGSAFYDCDNLTSVTIIDGVSVIGDWAFNSCSSLQTIIMPSSLRKIGSSAFKSCKKLKDVIIPDNVNDIGGYAFYGCDSLEKINIPNDVTVIDSFVFAFCDNLASITIPDSIVYIGKAAFAYCSSLGNIIIPNSVTFIDESAFGGCVSLESVIVKDGVKTIGFSAFRECSSLKNIIIPDSVTCMGEYVFYGCEHITNVHYNGTQVQWEKIEIGDYNSEFKSIVHMSTDENNDALCDLCNILISNHTHSYTSTITKLPTCTATGVKTFICTCGDVYTETIKATGHKTVSDKAVSASCTKKGLTEGSHCSVCKVIIKKQQTVAKKSHTYKTTTTKATLKKNGKQVSKCTECGEVKSSKTIYYPKSIKLSTSTYTYNGKVKTPTVVVKDSKGNTLKKGTDYTVKYENGRKIPGKYTVTITFKGKYDGTKKLTYTIAPRKVTKLSATQTSTSITLKWSKVTGADVYRVYKYNSNTGKYEKLKDVKKTTIKISKLKAGTTYKYKVRAITKDDGSIYGAYSDAFETATKCKTPSIKKISSSKKGVASITWSEVSGESGYQLYYSTSKDGTYKKVNSYSADKTAGSKTKLKSGKKYYFKVRAYKKTSSGTIYSSWSAVKSVKVK